MAGPPGTAGGRVARLAGMRITVLAGGPGEWAAATGIDLVNDA